MLMLRAFTDKEAEGKNALLKLFTRSMVGLE